MKNSPLKWKLLLSYGVIFLLVLVLGLTSVSVINLTAGQSMTYAETIVPAVEEIGLARRNMISVRRYLLNAIIAQTSLDYQRTIDSMNADQEALYTSLENIAEIMPQYAPEVQAIREKLDSVSAYNQEIIELAGKFGDTDAQNQAYVIYLDQYAVVFDEAAEMIIGLNDSIDQSTEAQEQLVASVRTISLVIVIAIVLCGFGAVVLFTILMLRYILVPVKSLIKAAAVLEEGDFSHTVAPYDSRDEFGQLSRAMNSSSERIVFIIRDLLIGLQAVSNGRFNVRSQDETRYKGEYCQLRDSMYQLNEMMSRTITQIRTSADQVASGAEQVANGAQALSQGSTEQASSVQELAATLEDISHQVRENTHSIEEVEASVEATVAEVTHSTEKMSTMLTAMNDIADSSAQIEKIISSIEDIAFQTNILALNAAVEAARAGEAGKGFAVVADEVRRLAAGTAEASKNTSSLISESLRSVQNGKQIADDTAASLERVNTIIRTLSQQARKVSQTSAAQDAAIQQTTLGVDQISAVVQNNSATAEESAAASQELSSQAHVLQNLTNRFEIETQSTRSLTTD